MAGCGGGCGGCNPCGNGCKTQCCKASCLKWGFDGCYLRGRCADGTELDPLDLCAWLKVHETCTEFKLVPESTTGGYMQFTNECGKEEKIYVCDFLSLGKLECLGNVYNRTPAKSCDLLVFSPDCGDEADPRHNKWSAYHIPDAGNCEIQPDNDGYYKVLTKNACGCIKECKLFAQSKTWEYALRDSWPDDPDWPFHTGSFKEAIDLQIDQKCPMFGKTDLEVTFQYGYGIQNTIHTQLNNPMKLNDYYNFQSLVTPTNKSTTSPSTSDKYSKCITTQGTNIGPWGSFEWQVSRTVIVPKGQKLFLAHEVTVHDYLGNIVADGGQGTTNPCSRLHQLHVFIRPTKGVQA